VTDIDPHAFDLAPLKDVASALSVSRSTIIRRVRAGEIPCARVGAGWRFPLRLILDVWLDDPGGAMVIWRRRASASPAEDAADDGPASSPTAPEIAKDYPVAARILTRMRGRPDGKG
jgi:excisionase family DNA binding protein